MRQVPKWGTIPRMLRDQAARQGDALIVADGPTRLRLTQLRRQAAEGARALIAMGVQPGDRVAIMAPNGFRWVISAFAVWDTGALAVPVSTQLEGAEAAQVIERTEASVLLACDDSPGTSPLSRLAGACGEPAVGRPFAGLPNLRTIVVLSPPPRMPGALQARRPGVLQLGNFLARGASVAARVAEQRALSVQPADLCEIVPTPGAAGRRKGVMLDHEQLLRSAWDWSEIVTLSQTDRFLVTASFSDGFGLNAGLLACVLRAATIVPVAASSSAALLDLIERQRVSVLAGPPNLFYRLLDSPPGIRRDVSSLQVAICAAAAGPAELIQRLRAELRVQRVISAYGLTEASVVAMTRPGDPVEVIAASAGRALPGMAIKIVDGYGAEVSAGTAGEILVRGYGVMRGYWKDEAQTTRAVDAAGYLHTGDMGVLDDRGNLALVDRTRDMFVADG